MGIIIFEPKPPDDPKTTRRIWNEDEVEGQAARTMFLAGLDPANENVLRLGKALVNASSISLTDALREQFGGGDQMMDAAIEIIKQVVPGWNINARRRRPIGRPRRTLGDPVILVQECKKWQKLLYDPHRVLWPHSKEFEEAPAWAVARLVEQIRTVDRRLPKPRLERLIRKAYSGRHPRRHVVLGITGWHCGDISPVEVQRRLDVIRRRARKAPQQDRRDD
jgi:hypothetical protein